MLHPGRPVEFELSNLKGFICWSSLGEVTYQWQEAESTLIYGNPQSRKGPVHPLRPHGRYIVRVSAVSKNNHSLIHNKKWVGWSTSSHKLWLLMFDTYIYIYINFPHTLTQTSTASANRYFVKRKPLLQIKQAFWHSIHLDCLWLHGKHFINPQHVPLLLAINTALVSN